MRWAEAAWGVFYGGAAVAALFLLVAPNSPGPNIVKGLTTAYADLVTLATKG